MSAGPGAVSPYKLASVLLQYPTQALFDGIPDGSNFYFVHSYAGEPAPSAADAILATTTHGTAFTSAVARGPIAGVQFHPERSGRDGLRFLSNFVGSLRTSAFAVAAPEAAAATVIGAA